MLGSHAPPDVDAAGKAATGDLAQRFTRAQLVVAEASMIFTELDRPDLVIDAINQLVKSVRTEGVPS